MDGSSTLLTLAGDVAILLWGLYMVKSGIMRALGTDIRRYLGIALRNRFKGFFAGLFATTLLQSSTATGMMAASFTASRMVGLIPAMALMLGANVGTTLIVQVFSFDISHIAPVLVLCGFIMFRRSRRTKTHDYGRALIGLGFMLLSLHLMHDLLKPAEESEAIRLLLNAITEDKMLVMFVTALITWIMHSSVAVVLLSISLCSQNLIPLPIAFAMTLGANLGSALGPMIETNTAGNPAARRLPLGNLINRAVGCLLALPFISLIAHSLPQDWATDPARSIAWFHTLFNLGVAILFFPFLTPLANFVQKVLPERIATEDLSMPHYLDMKNQNSPSLALANAARETLRLADMVEKMLQNTFDMLVDNDRKKLEAVRESEEIVEKLNKQIKYYITALKHSEFTEEEAHRAREILTFTLNIEHISDIAGNSLVKLCSKKIKEKLVFSAEGWQDIRDMFEHVVHNVQVASAVMMTRDVRTARQLLAEKRTLREMENESTERHFARLREGRAESIETSSLHLDMLRDLMRINSYLAKGSIKLLEENNILLPSQVKD